MSQLEKLTMSNINSEPPLGFHISKLTALRELEVSNCNNLQDESMLIVGGVEEIQRLSRLEKLTLSADNLSSSADIKRLCRLLSLHELDLTGCSKIDDRAVPYLQKITGLRKLSLEGTGITNDGADKIDDALPNCRVIY